CPPHSPPGSGVSRTLAPPSQRRELAVVARVSGRARPPAALSTLWRARVPAPRSRGGAVSSCLSACRVLPKTHISLPGNPLARSELSTTGFHVLPGRVPQFSQNTPLMKIARHRRGPFPRRTLETQPADGVVRD